MKKIILTGVVLLLGIIIAVDIYNDYNRNNKNKLQATAAIPGSSVAAPIATPLTTTNGLDNNNGSISQSPEATNYKHARPRTKHITPVDGNMALAANNPASGGISGIDEENQTPDVGAKTSKSFYGNTPKTTDEQQKQISATFVTEHRSNVHFGPEISIMQNSLSNEQTQNMSRIGFRAGAIADIGLGDHFALQPGLMYELKGVEFESINSGATTTEIDTKDKINLNYIELPIDFVVKFGDWHDGRFMIGAGPYIAYLIRAQDNYQTTTTTYENVASRTTQVTPDNEIAGHTEVTNGQYSLIGNNTPGNITMRNLDWGINGFVGCEMPDGFFAKAGTEAGMIDIQRNADGSYTNRNINFFVSLGYLIGYKR